MSAEEVLFYYQDEAQMTRGDLHLFKAPAWLNDRCINFYFRVLEHEEFAGRPDLLFLDPAVVSCMLIQCTDEEDLKELAGGLRLDTRSMVFIPTNDAEEFFSGCTHWSLLVFCTSSKGEEKSGSFFHFDSSCGRNESAAMKTAAQFWRMFTILEGRDVRAERQCPRVDAINDCPQQENGYDCGMYVLGMTKYVAHLFVTQGSGVATRRGSVAKEGENDEGSGTCSFTGGKGSRLDTTGLGAHVSSDAMGELRRRLALKIEKLAGRVPP